VKLNRELSEHAEKLGRLNEEWEDASADVAALQL
jgi:hypothetical protein